MPRAEHHVARIRETVSGAARAAVGRHSLPVWILVAAIAAAITALLIFGGLDRVTAAAPQVAEGEEVALSLYTITVTDAEMTTEIEDQFLEAEDGEAFLVLTVRMENLSDATIGVGRTADRIASRLIGVQDPLLDLTGITTLDDGQSWRTDGSAGAVYLQPGVPADFQIAWRVQDEGGTDATLQLDVYDARARGGQILLSADDVTWRRGDLAASIAVVPR